MQPVPASPATAAEAIPLVGPARPLGRYSPRRLVALLALAGAALAGVALVAALFGGVPLHVGAALANEGPDGTIFWTLRLPRVALGAIVGAGLCAAGSALQALLQNPLADPFVLGVSGGAAAGATAALLVGELLGARIGAWSQGVLGFSPQIVFGFGGALISAFLVRSIGSRSGRLVGAAALLAGAVLNAVAGALVLLSQLALSPERAQQILLWLAGSLGYPPPSTLGVASLCVTTGCLGLCLLAGRIRLLALGNDEAAQLGVDVPGTVRWTLALSSLVVAAAVAVSGLIGFVGLLVPHLLRLRLGPDQRLLLPASVFGGAIFLIAADAVGRLAFLPARDRAPGGGADRTPGRPALPPAAASQSAGGRVTALAVGRGLSFSYGAKPVLLDVNVSIQAGELVALIGPNAAGKSTLLRLLAGLLTPAAGGVELGGKAVLELNVEDRARQIALVPQELPLERGLTVGELALTGLVPQFGTWSDGGEAGRARAREALLEAGIAELADRSLATLSGGELRRAMVARALVRQPRLLLMDEPLASLDLGAQGRVLGLARSMSARGAAVVLALHDLNLALQEFSRVWLLVGGRLEGDGPPERVLTLERVESAFGPARRAAPSEALFFPRVNA